MMNAGYPSQALCLNSLGQRQNTSFESSFHSYQDANDEHKITSLPTVSWQQSSPVITVLNLKISNKTACDIESVSMQHSIPQGVKCFVPHFVILAAIEH
eukprot:15191225-Ditylum_brightwellii.AAC.2